MNATQPTTRNRTMKTATLNTVARQVALIALHVLYIAPFVTLAYIIVCGRF